ncbi:MAG: hypothetical protein V2A67_01410 [Bacteroidota bacterium]
MRQNNKYYISIVFVFLPVVLLCQENRAVLNYSGQLSAVHVSKFSRPYEMCNGLRYIPKLEAGFTFKNGVKIDGEASLNGSMQSSWVSNDTLTFDGRLKPYRIWARFAGERYELRAGLQKINFGSAVMLRPLMWFDQMDPRDPLQLTDGVYALLGRYFFQNNANIWLWGIWPGKNPKGWEMMASDRYRPEFGGRVQVPAGPGEIALSTHYRFIGTDQTNGTLPVTQEEPVPEFRIGLDGKWDIGPGIWFEGTYTYSDSISGDIKHQRMLTLGVDYTFGIGNGLTCMAEQFIYSMGSAMWESSKSMNFTATSLTYPINLTHSLSAMVFYNWEDNDWYRFINWGISLTNISFYLIAFWNPDRFDLYQNTGNSNLMGGKGIQVMFVWTH